jgi:hypothetical protein
MQSAHQLHKNHSGTTSISLPFPHRDRDLGRRAVLKVAARKKKHEKTNAWPFGRLYTQGIPRPPANCDT